MFLHYVSTRLNTTYGHVHMTLRTCGFLFFFCKLLRSNFSAILVIKSTDHKFVISQVCLLFQPLCTWIIIFRTFCLHLSELPYQWVNSIQHCSHDLLLFSFFLFIYFFVSIFCLCTHFRKIRYNICSHRYYTLALMVKHVSVKCAVIL